MPEGPENHYGFTQEEVEAIKKFVLIAIENKVPLDKMFPGQDRLAQEAAFLYLLLTNPQAEWIYGLSPDPQDPRDILAREVVAQPTTVTKKFVDLSSYCSPVENQNTLGSCSAHGIVGAVELLEKKENRFLDRSRMFLYYNTRALMGTINTDSGAYLRDALKAAQKYGICNEQEWPYIIKNWKTKPFDKAYADGATFKINKYAALKDNDIMEACSMIEKGFPVIIGMYCFSSLTSEKIMQDGILEMPSPGEKSEGGHAVCCVGFDMEHKYFKMRNSWGCYDKDTEILTKDGWKFFKDLTGDEEVATLNPDTHYLEYSKIEARQEYKYTGDLWNYNGRDIDLLVTPNHNLFLKDNRKDATWELKKAEDIKIKLFHMKKNANWEGEEKDFYEFSDYKISMDTWVEFMGYFLSEGHASHSSSYRKARLRRHVVKNKCYYCNEKARQQDTYAVGIAQKYRDEKIQKCLASLPFSFCWCKNGTWSTNNKKLYEELKVLGKSFEKYIPAYLKALSTRQLKILFDAMMLGDGSGKPLKKWTYYTSSRKLADDMQEIALKLGYAADISFTDRVDSGKSGTIHKYTHIEYRIGIKIKETEPMNRSGGFVPIKIPYNDKVYCVTVPNHIIYVRRNGKAVWSGNSAWGSKGYFYMPFAYYEQWTFSPWTVLGLG